MAQCHRDTATAEGNPKSAMGQRNLYTRCSWTPTLKTPVGKFSVPIWRPQHRGMLQEASNQQGVAGEAPKRAQPVTVSTASSGFTGTLSLSPHHYL